MTYFPIGRRPAKGHIVPGGSVLAPEIPCAWGIWWTTAFAKPSMYESYQLIEFHGVRTVAPELSVVRNGK
jgi:hypothetical protein